MGNLREYEIRPGFGEDEINVIGKYYSGSDMIHKIYFFRQMQTIEGQSPKYVVLQGTQAEPKVGNLSREEAQELIYSRALDFARRVAQKHRCELVDLVERKTASST